jgi:hypothetical protein
LNKEFGTQGNLIREKASLGIKIDDWGAKEIMKDSELEKLELELRKAKKEVRSAESTWVDAKRSYYKAWEREYEFANDESRVKESISWQRSSERAFCEAEERKHKAEIKVKAIKEKISILIKDGAKKD